jgi:hypothetical protein
VEEASNDVAIGSQENVAAQHLVTVSKRRTKTMIELVRNFLNAQIVWLLRGRTPWM